MTKQNDDSSKRKKSSRKRKAKTPEEEEDQSVNSNTSLLTSTTLASSSSSTSSSAPVFPVVIDTMPTKLTRPKLKTTTAKSATTTTTTTTTTSTAKSSSAAAEGSTELNGSKKRFCPSSWLPTSSSSTVSSSTTDSSSSSSSSSFPHPSSEIVTHLKTTGSSNNTTTTSTTSSTTTATVASGSIPTFSSSSKPRITKSSSTSASLRLLEKIASTPTTPMKPPIRMATPGIFDQNLKSMLNCTVCFTMPEENIYQCSHGHVLCHECHLRITSSDRSNCPTCRVRMSRQLPSRNVIAENYRDHVPMKCSNVGCKEQLTYKLITDHMNKTCPFRMEKCDYEQLGCVWEDLAQKLPDHVESCPFQHKTGKELVETINAHRESKKKKEEETKAAAELCMRILNLLSCRCRQVIVRDVRLEVDPFDRVMCSTPFNVFGDRWIARLRPKKRSKPLGIEMERLPDFRTSRLPCNIVIMKGPSLAMDLMPSIHKCTFKPSVNKSKRCPLPLNDVEGKRLLDCTEVHLRIIFIDQRAGLERQFTSLRDNSGGDGRDGAESPSDSEADEVGDDPTPGRGGNRGLRGLRNPPPGFMSDLIQEYQSMRHNDHNHHNDDRGSHSSSGDDDEWRNDDWNSGIDLSTYDSDDDEHDHGY